MNALAVEVMNEIGIDISRQRSKHLDEYGEAAFDYLVTLCDDAAKICPLFPGEGTRMHKGFSDPAAAAGIREERLAAFRKVRDELKDYILSFSSHES
jgi:arsenate reductase